MPPKDRKLERLARITENGDNSIVFAANLTFLDNNEIEDLEKRKILLFIGYNDEVTCNKCHKQPCTVNPKIVDYPDGQKKGVCYCSDSEQGGRLEFELDELKYWEINKDKLIELGCYEAPEMEDLNNFVYSLYLELNLAERTVIVGEKIFDIRSEKVWAFFKELAHDRKQRQVTKRTDGHNDWKNARDMFRRQLQKDFKKEGAMILKRMIPSSKGCYTLDSSVVVTGGGQVGIRRTKSKQRKPGIN